MGSTMAVPRGPTVLWYRRVALVYPEFRLYQATVGAASASEAPFDGHGVWCGGWAIWLSVSQGQGEIHLCMTSHDVGLVVKSRAARRFVFQLVQVDDFIDQRRLLCAVGVIVRSMVGVSVGSQSAY